MRYVVVTMNCTAINLPLLDELSSRSPHDASFLLLLFYERNTPELELDFLEHDVRVEESHQLPGQEPKSDASWH